jgi:hypothetical protein
VPDAAPGPSRRHSNVPPDSLAEKVKVCELPVTEPAGPVRIVVSGECVSTRTVRDALRAETLDAASVAVAV